jgi:hypothetical protein
MKDIYFYENNFPNELGYLGEKELPRIFDKHLQNDFDNMSNFEQQFYVANGRELPKDKFKYLHIYDYLLKSAVYNDIKIWPNRIAGYSGASQNSSFGTISAASCCMESKIMGYVPLTKSYETFVEINKIKNNKTIKELSKMITPNGYGRPKFGKDERVILFKEKFINDEFLNDFPTVKLAFNIEKELDGNMFLNYGGLGAAFIVDFGITMKEYKNAHLLVFMQVSHGIKEFVLENTPNEKFLPVRSEKIIYEGSFKIGRKW